MRIFNKFKKSNGLNNEIENIARKNSNTAVNYAKSFEKNFDYSSNSIKGLGKY